MTCALCEAADVTVFLTRDQAPVHQNVLYGDAESARAVARGQLQMTVCGQCGFVYNAAFDPARITYARGYDNDQTFSPYFDRYVDSLIEQLKAQVGIDGRSIAEIGCGSGYFLDRLVAASTDSVGVGYDPSYSGQVRSADGRVSYVTSHFTGNGRRADLVICRHVIEHVSRPAEFAATIRDSVDPGASVVIETPAVEWILGNHVIWDFFYEHCSLFSASSLARVFAASGFEVRTVDPVFNGQYLWLTASATGTARRRARHDPDPAIADACRRFAAVERVIRQRWEEVVERARVRGPVAVWGAGAKGSTFVNLLDPAAEQIACVVDVNPRKQGRYIAGSGHRVVSPQALADGIQTVFIMNPNYESEIRSAAAAVAPALSFVTP